MEIKQIVHKIASSMLVWLLLSVQGTAMAKEVHTILVPDVSFVHQASSDLPQQATQAKGGSVAIMQSTVSDLRMVLGHLILVLGGVLLVTSVFQFFRYQKNPSATLFTQVSTTFLCAIITIGVSYLAAVG